MNLKVKGREDGGVIMLKAGNRLIVETFEVVRFDEETPLKSNEMLVLLTTEGEPA